jgi:hypothetical protein
MADNFLGHTKGLDDPADTHYLIVPDDAADLPHRPRALWCAAAGTAAIGDRAGAVLSYSLAAGQILPFRGTRVLATGTTATLYGWE